MLQIPGLYKTIRIKDIQEQAEGFKSFTFEEGHDIHYQAGQYLTFVTHRGDREIRRSYSFTSSPVLKEPLSIGVKRVTHGFFSTQLIDQAQAGDALITTGAGGLFILPENIPAYKQVFFFAAGSGITPIYSLLKTALYLYPHLSIVLIYSNASPGSTIFLQPLLELKNEFTDRFQLELLFSNSPALSTARLHRELLLEFLERYSIAATADMLFYTCGPFTYMRMCTFVLKEAYVPADHIKRETFIVDQPIPHPVMPPDRNQRKAVINVGGNTYKVEVDFPDSILQAAKKQGITLPYSCETGRCGNCLARCTRGRVWLSYNEVLTDKELAKGLTLTCVGHPVGGDVELVIDSP